MTISDEEFIAIVEAAASHDDFLPPKRRNASPVTCGVRNSRGVRRPLSRPPRVHLPRWANEFREMLSALGELEFRSRRSSPLQKVCQVGSQYGLRMLERTVSSELLHLLSPKAKRRLKDNLQRVLMRATGPCFALELNAFRCAFEAIYSEKGAATTELERPPHHRIISLFKNFPVLAKLWCLLISQWRDQIAELLLRFSADRVALSRTFFATRSVDKIADIRPKLSDPHNRGRTVMLLRCKAGSIIYKPRSGYGEREWFSFVRYLNARSLRPKLRAARILCRDGYCWMEEIRFAPCKNHAAARRFYERLGGVIAAVYLLRAVDCHRDNLIACGEYPVLIDAETLWHVTRKTQILSPLDALYETGFFPSDNRRSSWQYRSSVLGKTTTGLHIPRIGIKPLSVGRYKREIVNGFKSAWDCVLGNEKRRASFVRQLRTINRLRRRWLYWPTANYDRIRQASVQPAALRSGTERDILIARLCDQSVVPPTVIRAEIDALKRLDIPYFIRQTPAIAVVEPTVVPMKLVQALREALR
jgi:lantibiotic modifying enzyme